MSRLLFGGVLVLTAREARMLYQGARIAELRAKHRVGNSAFYALLVDITQLALSDPNAGSGNLPRQSTASNEADLWTVKQVAAATGLAPRTVRLDIEEGTLPATKPAGSWLIQKTDAATYIDRRRNH